MYSATSSKLLLSLFLSSALTALAQLPPLRTNGTYALPAPDGTSETYVVALNEYYQKPDATTHKGTFKTTTQTNAVNMANFVQGVTNTTGKEHMLVLYRAGYPKNAANRRVLTRRVWVNLPTAYDETTMAAAVGATASRPSYSKTGVIFTFNGVADALRGMEYLKLQPGVTYATAITASRNKRPKDLPNDPFFYRNPRGYQWHLWHQGPPALPPIGGMDINILGGPNGTGAVPDTIWSYAVAGVTAPRYNGTGIRVNVVDDGLEVGHEDLQINSSNGFDYVGDDTDVSHGGHGTAVAGLIAARDNALGGLGVAPRAKMFGYRVLGGDFDVNASDEEFADAISRIAEVGNHSWGESSNFAALVAAEYDALDSLPDRMAFVKAAGNEAPNNVNFEQLNNSRLAIIVAASLDTGAFADYSNPGANLTVSGPSGGDADGPNAHLFTTDRTGTHPEGYNPGLVPPANPGVFPLNTNYTNDFNGTSGSTPIVSGVIALLHHASKFTTSVNRSPSYRDFMGAMMRSAFVINPSDLDWQINGGGLFFNHKCGAGQVNAWGSVDSFNVTPRLDPVLRLPNVTNREVNIPPGPSITSYELRIGTSPRRITEHAEIDIVLQHPAPGNLNIRLISPSGTVSDIQPISGSVRPPAWSYSTTFNWGECSGGTWTVVIINPPGGPAGRVIETALDVWGTGAAPVTAPPTITSAPLMEDGIQYCEFYDSYRITATECPFRFGAIGLPAGLKVDALSGLISGYPAEAGVFNVILTATNEMGTGQLPVVLTILPWLRTPTQAGSPVALATNNEPFRMQLYATPANNTITLGGALPPGLAYDPVTQLITGVPALPPTTVFPVTFHVPLQIENYCGENDGLIHIIVQRGAFQLDHDNDPTTPTITVPGRTLAEALDIPPRTFTLDGVDSWFWGDANWNFRDFSSPLENLYNRGDSAYSPIFSPFASASMSTDVVGDVFVSFDWKISDATDSRFLRFEIDGVERAAITGQVGWNRVTFRTGATGPHTLTWIYDNVDEPWAGEDRGQVDHMTITAASFAGFQEHSFAFTGLAAAQQDATADPDGDGRSNLLEYALGGNPLVADSVQNPRFQIQGDRFCFIFDVDTHHTDLSFQAEASDNNSGWRPVDAQLVSEVNGVRTLCVQEPIQNSTKRFYRLKVTRQ